MTASPISPFAILVDTISVDETDDGLSMVGVDLESGRRVSVAVYAAPESSASTLPMFVLTLSLGPLG